jgi:hypothetical protein
MTHLLRHGLIRIAATGAVIALAGAGCSDDGDGPNNGGGNSANAGSGNFGATGGSGNSGTGAGGAGNAGTGAGGAGNSGSGFGGSSATSGGGGANAPACAGLPVSGDAAGAAGAGMTCTGVGAEVERVEVDMYIMMDRSVSMIDNCIGGGRPPCATQTRWEVVQEAVQQFVENPGPGIRMGIQFFGASGQQDDAIDCDVTRYSTPLVEIGDPATIGGDLVDAVTSTIPGGITPMRPALQGAIDHAKEWAADPANANRAVVAVLVTDGYPTQCGTSVADIAAIAEEAHTNLPSVRTYVVGVAADLNLGSIAARGGTKEAYIVDQADATTAFVNALNNISNNELACEYAIPESPDPTMQLDYDKVQVIYTPAVGEPQEIPRARSFADCADSDVGGWYYDSSANPSRIQVCPCTCSNFAAGSVEIRLGCEPRPIPIE